MYLKIHNTKEGKIVAACDKELIGTVLEQKGGACMDLKTYRNFFVGELAAEEQLKAALRDFSSANLVGKKVVGIAVKERIVGKKDIKYINDVPYIQIYRI
ncbi:MAG: DUF424 family protein [Candidatus Micrarchaeota archaeon]